MKICILSPVSLLEIKDLLYPEEQENVPECLKFTVTASLIRNYLEQGHEVVVVTLDKDILESKIFHGPNLTVYVGRYRKSARLRAVTFFNYEIKQMYEFGIRNKCDIYHAHWEYEFALAALKIDRKSTIVTLHDWPFIILRYLPQFYRFQRLLMSMAVFAFGEWFTAVSPYIADKYRSFTHRLNIDVVPNAVKNENKHLPIKYLNKKAPRFITINNGFDNRKNVQVAIQAFQIIRESFCDATLHLYGIDYAKGESAEKWCVDNNINLKNIFFEGTLNHEEIYEELQKADLLIHTSKEESFGLIFIEAMLNGTPSLGGINSGAVHWVLNNGKIGVLADILEPQDVAERVVSLLNDENRWTTYREQGFQYAKDIFSIETVSNQYLECYKHVIERKKQ